VKWFSSERGYGVVEVTDTLENLFLPARVIGPDADLPAGTTLTVRAGLDLKGKGRSVVSVLAIDRSTATNISTGRRMPLIVANRVERGKLDRKTASGSGFIVADMGADIYVPGAVLAAALDVRVGDRIEADVGDGDKGPVAIRIRQI
jgi:cold shock CspA family protein